MTKKPSAVDWAKPGADKTVRHIIHADDCMIEAERISGKSHVCGGGEVSDNLSCCTNEWGKVTCKRCLKLKGAGRGKK